MARVAILVKDDLTGVIAEALPVTVPTVAVNDPRQPQFKMLRYHSLKHARAGFDDVLRISQSNGWLVGWLGERNAE